MKEMLHSILQKIKSLLAGYIKKAKPPIARLLNRISSSVSLFFRKAEMPVSTFFKKLVLSVSGFLKKIKLLVYGFLKKNPVWRVTAAVALPVLVVFLAVAVIPGFQGSGSPSGPSSSVTSASSGIASSTMTSSTTESSSPAPTASPAATASPSPSPSPSPAPTATPAPLHPNSMGIAIPSNLRPGIPEGLLAVPAVQKTAWMSSLSLFPASTRCEMFLWIDPAIAQAQETAGRITAMHLAGSSNGHGTIPGAGLLVALQTDRNDYKAELLSVDLAFNGTFWQIVPTKNTPSTGAAGGILPLSQQLRIVSPRLPLTPIQANDTSKLQVFDPSPYVVSGKAPYRMCSAAILPFLGMLRQAESDGIAQITVRDTYRGFEQQDSMFQSIIRYYQRIGYSSKDALERTRTETAEAGTSEHHAGFTADIITGGATMNQGFGLTPFGLWIKDHCWEHGFIVRYPAGKEIQTTKKYEPWHVRYVGLPTSHLFEKYGIVLDEFHAWLAENQFIFSVLPDKEKGGSESSLYLYVRCGKGTDVVLPDRIQNASSTLLSEVGDGSVVLLCKIS